MLAALNLVMIFTVVQSAPVSRLKLKNPTVLIHLGSYSLSKKAFQLGLFMAVLQVADGLLTYAGLGIYGLHMEGNVFLRNLIMLYGAFPTLFVAKTFALGCVAWLTILAHEKRWIRPALGLMCGIYLATAIVPWTYLVSRAAMG